jgi:hypothetical protein
MASVDLTPLHLTQPRNNPISAFLWPPPPNVPKPVPEPNLRSNCPIYSHKKNRILRRKNEGVRHRKHPYYPAFSRYYPVNSSKKGKRSPVRAPLGYALPPYSGVHPLTEGDPGDPLSRQSRSRAPHGRERVGIPAGTGGTCQEIPWST